jgi:hypothetical protein
MDLRRLTQDVEIISQLYAEVVDFPPDDAWYLRRRVVPEK